MSLSTLNIRAQSLPLESLRNIVLGIDVQHYLNNILGPNVDPYYEAIGGFPLSLEKRILQDAAVMESYGIKPVYVLPGLRPKPQILLSESKSLLPYEEELKAKWEAEKLSSTFRPKTKSSTIRALSDDLLIIFQENDLEYIISPYTQYHQLVYMMQSSVINSIYSSREMLLFPDLDNFIVDLNFEHKKFDFFNNDQTIKSFGLSYAQFRDISMATGNNMQPVQLIKDSFETLAEGVRSGMRNIYEEIPKNLKTFIDGGSILEYCPVLKTNGRVEQMFVESTDTMLFAVVEPSWKKLDDAKDVPTGLNDLFGSHFPEEVYFYQSIGLDVFRLIEAFDTQIYTERLPLDLTADSIYEKVISSHQSMTLKELLFDYFSSLLHRYYHHRKIVQNCYFSSASPTAKLPISKGIEYAKKNPSLVGLLVRHGTARSFDFTSLVTGLNNTFLEESSHSPSVEDGLTSISSNYEIISTSILRTLFAYNFFEIEKMDGPYSLSPIGQAFVKHASKHKSHIEMDLLAFILLQRFKDTNTKELQKSSFNDLCKLGELNSLEIKEPINISSLALIAKFATLYKIKNWKDENYKGPVSRELLHFHSIMSVIQREIRDFIVVHTLKLMFGNRNDVDKFNRDNSEWTSLATEIPYKSKLPNTVSGLMVLKTIETYIKSSSDLTSFKSKLEEELSCFSTYIQNPVKEVKNILSFVSELSDIADVLREAKLIQDDVYGHFEAIKSTIADITVKL